MLAEVAIRILGAPITSAATERTFSTFSWIHNKNRNRLTTTRAAKLTYLSHNWKLLEKKQSSTSKQKRITSGNRHVGLRSEDEGDDPLLEEIVCSDASSERRTR